MRKREAFIIGIATVTAAIVLAVAIVLAITSVNDKMSQYCFDELESTAKNLASELDMSMQTDSTLLEAMGQIIASQDNPSNQQLASIMDGFELHDSYVSSVEVLTPDNRLLRKDGAVADVTGYLDFQQEAAKGAYISSEATSAFDGQTAIVRNAVPVTRDGQVIAMLYGVVPLDELAQRYTTDIYDGAAYVYVEDAATGRFLLDTWHKTRGNIADLGERKTAPGYSFSQMIDDVQQGLSGNLCFVSQSTGKKLYLHHEPIGVNDWNIIVTVDEGSAFKKMSSISDTLYVMTGIIALALIAYLVVIIACLTRLYKAMHRHDNEDKITKLGNRNAFEEHMSLIQYKEFELITCAYVDANGLHEVNNEQGHDAGDALLRAVGAALKRQFPAQQLFRIGGDEFVVLCEGMPEDEVRAGAEKARAEVEQQGYSISIGIASRRDEEGARRVVSQADGLMLDDKRIYYQSHDRRR